VSHIRGRVTAGHWIYVWALIVAPVIYAAAFPLSRTAWLAWIGLVPWCVALRVARTPAAVAICWVSTMLGSYLCTPWLTPAVANYYQQPLALGLLLFIGVWIVTIGPFVTAFTLAYRQLARRPSLWLPLLAGAAWTAGEVGRVRLLVGDPFGLFGYSQVNVTSLVQIADVTGVYGLSVLLIATNAALAELWLAYWPLSDGARTGGFVRPTPPQAWRGIAVVAGTLVAVAGYGSVRVRAFDAAAAATSTRIAIVQGNLDLGSQWRQEFYGRNLEQYMRLTVQTLREHQPQVVFWPESAMTFFLEDEPLYRAALGELLTPTRTQLVAGGPRAVGQPNPRYYNSGFLIAANGTVSAAYDKQHLLPFAEYFPFGGNELLRREFARVREFTPGGPAQLLPTIAGPAGVVICNEAMFGEIVTERVRAGAGYLVTLANDSWLGDRKFAEQAFDMARLRAVEQHRYLVRASTSGPSAIVDPLGRVVTRTPAEARATVGGTIRPLHGLTVYARCGDLFGLLCALIPLAVMLRDRLCAAAHSAQSPTIVYADRRSADRAA
jgi:apolipoprotein N-acyltransferase